MAAKTVTSTIVNDKKNLLCNNPIPNNGEQILRDTKQVTILYRKKNTCLIGWLRLLPTPLFLFFKKCSYFPGECGPQTQ